MWFIRTNIVIQSPAHVLAMYFIDIIIDGVVVGAEINAGNL